MEDQQKPENNVKKHLSSLHKRIQHKYIEMQRKLEKSKSVDSISNLSDEFDHNFAYGSLVDLRETDEVFICETKSAIVENVHRQNAVSRDLEFEATFTIIESQKSLEDLETFDGEPADTKSNLSIESLNEAVSDDSSRPTPPPRTIRQRFIAARERRKEEREKQMEKKKEKMEKLILTNIKQDASVEAKLIHKISRKSKLATVTLAIIEVTGLESLSDGKERMLYCRYRLGTEKGKTKVTRSSDSVVKWQELYNVNMFDEYMLELTCFDSKILLGRHMLDLSELEKDQTHKLRLDLHEGETSGVKIFVLITISGISLLNTLIEIDDLEKAKKRLVQGSIKPQNEIVGSLSVIVYGAKGLSAQDCYCVVKLINDRLQTHTEYKTHDPNWMKIFTFHVTDITSILEISVVEEKRTEEVGKISIPLLRIHNGENIWYALKDSSQRERAKGNNPRILLEMKTSWNLWKASIRVINPKEDDFLEASPKLDRRLFARNLSRTRAVVNWTLDTLKVMKSCFEWESKKWNTVGLILWINFCYFFKMWMLPLLFLIPFVRYRPEKYVLSNFMKKSWWNKPKHIEIIVKKEDKSTLRQKINSLAEMVASVQNGIGKVASLGESIKNLVNFTVPYVSILAVVFILLVAFVMFVVPLKYILICWGIHKFTRKILRPNRIPNSEILDLLSRVPDDETLHDCMDMPLEVEDEE